jgi:phosphatidyl-myo-inositol dimannoside synthase
MFYDARSMSKILLLTPDAPPKRGGVARYIGATLRARSDIFLDVLPVRAGTLWIFLRLFRFRPQEIWTHHIVPVGTACWLYSFFHLTSYTVFLHGLDFDLVRRNVWKRFLARRILLRAKRVVVNSKSLRHEVVQFIKRDDVEVIYPCVSSELIVASETKRKGLKHHTPEELAKMFVSQVAGSVGAGVAVVKKDAQESVKLLTVARLVERKGHVKVLRALQKVPNVTYTIVGDGPMREVLHQEAMVLGVIDRVSFLATVSDEQLPNVYASHDIFVMPTTKSEYDREGFGIVYAEAGVFGLPCIATDIPGVNEAIVHKSTGLLIEDTPRAFCEAIKKLADSPGLRSRLGGSARVYVLEQFTEKVFADKISYL